VLVQLNGSNARTLISYAGLAVINGSGFRSAEFSDSYMCIRDGLGNITIDGFGMSGLFQAKALAARNSPWNGGDGAGAPLRIGAYHFWVDSLSRLRMKAGVPTGDLDGVVVGTQA
jgi:hypothetical protein